MDASRRISDSSLPQTLTGFPESLAIATCVGVSFKFVEMHREMKFSCGAPSICAAGRAKRNCNSSYRGAKCAVRTPSLYGGSRNLASIQHCMFAREVTSMPANHAQSCLLPKKKLAPDRQGSFCPKETDLCSECFQASST